LTFQTFLVFKTLPDSPGFDILGRITTLSKENNLTVFLTNILFEAAVSRDGAKRYRYKVAIS
jgi:hypothetical protein